MYECAVAILLCIHCEYSYVARTQAARAQGLEPNAFPYHYYFWPKWVNDNCWAGIAQIGWCVYKDGVQAKLLLCTQYTSHYNSYGQDQYPCRAEVAQPWWVLIKGGDHVVYTPTTNTFPQTGLHSRALLRMSWAIPLG